MATASEAPSALEPPDGINPDAIELWIRACSEVPSTGRSARVRTTKAFLELCTRAGLQPFQEANPNPAIREFLKHRRRLYVRYLGKTKLMDRVRVRKVTRDAYLTSYGLGIRIEAWSSVPDAYWFRHLKATPDWRFSLMWDEEHRCQVQLDPGITVYVRNPNIRSPLTWFVGYEIHCPLTPKLRDLTSANILRSLWDPVALTIRPKGTLPQRRI